MTVRGQRQDRGWQSRPPALHAGTVFAFASAVVMLLDVKTWIDMAQSTADWSASPLQQAAPNLLVATAVMVLAIWLFGRPSRRALAAMLACCAWLAGAASAHVDTILDPAQAIDLPHSRRLLGASFGLVLALACLAHAVLRRGRPAIERLRNDFS
ncbi:hypothetical protein [Novosphingobium sp. TH158]|uniref:hypothetical protein n=1 Tax=Novosphingobium sp. TH158 TaxID=2067455 RepID=UPI000C79BD7F|nr:hypothetical protein [Novosphingobium sp. TH158]PLK27276.1 hypothetical protein C0V78_10530 [Novosphingobium sp. TH158]